MSLTATPPWQRRTLYPDSDAPLTKTHPSHRPPYNNSHWQRSPLTTIPVKCLLLALLVKKRCPLESDTPWQRRPRDSDVPLITAPSRQRRILDIGPPTKAPPDIRTPWQRSPLTTTPVKCCSCFFQAWLMPLIWRYLLRSDAPLIPAPLWERRPLTETSPWQKRPPDRDGPLTAMPSW